MMASKHNYTYMVKCADGSLYTGWTTDLEKRIRTHNEGKGAKYTRSRRPVELAYCEAFDTKEQAMSREFHMKRLTRQQKEALAGEWAARKEKEGSLSDKEDLITESEAMTDEKPDANTDRHIGKKEI